jgi:hypothetical protein
VPLRRLRLLVPAALALATACGATDSLKDLVEGVAGLDAQPAYQLDAGAYPDAMMVSVDAGHPDAQSQDAGPTDANFPVASHPMLPRVPNNGGPILAQPRVVLVFFRDEPNRAVLEAHANWIVGSSWLNAVGTEYGVGTASILGSVATATNAPMSVTDADIQTLLTTGIMNHSIPRPSDGTFVDTLYMVYFPSHTTITANSGAMGTQAASCVIFDGYHSEVDNMMGTGTRFAYAVIAACPSSTPGLTDIEDEELTVSHELIEAATDPYPFTNPAWAFSASTDTPWATIGGEIGDLCAIPRQAYRSATFIAQRIWSNEAAFIDIVDPCVPPDPMKPYYQTGTIPDGVRLVQRGDTISFILEGWSTAQVQDWALSPLIAQGDMTPTFMLDRSTMNNGGRGTLQVTVPPGAAAGSFALIWLTSALTADDFRWWPIVVVAN